MPTELNHLVAAVKNLHEIAREQDISEPLIQALLDITKEMLNAPADAGSAPAKHFRKTLESLETGTNEAEQKLRETEDFTESFQRIVELYNNYAQDFDLPTYQSAVQAKVIGKLSLKNFTVFENLDLSFAPGVNVIYGENGTGKSMLLKLIFSAVRAIESEKPHPDEFLRILRSTFMVTEKDALIRFTSPGGSSSINYTYGDNLTVKKSPEIILKNGEKFTRYQNTLPAPEKDNPLCFIPSKEIVSAHSNLVSLIESDSLKLDETYRHFAQLLSKGKVNGLYPKVEGLADQCIKKFRIGTLEYDSDQDDFYIRRQTADAPMSVNMEAEGYRKIHTLLRLMKNGSIAPGKILLWDEPETNMNSAILRDILDILTELAVKHHVQVILASHSTFLGHYMDLKSLKEKTNIRFINLYRTEAGIEHETGAKLSDLSKLSVTKADVSIFREKSNLLWNA